MGQGAGPGGNLFNLIMNLAINVLTRSKGLNFANDFQIYTPCLLDELPITIEQLNCKKNENWEEWKETKNRKKEENRFKGQLIFWLMSKALILFVKILNSLIFLVVTSNLFQINMATIPKEASRERVDFAGTEKKGLLRVENWK